jgi:hypothetical protein
MAAFRVYDYLLAGSVVELIMNTKVPVTTDVCPTCGGNNGVHAYGCSEPGEGEQASKQDKSPAAMTAVAVSRINGALAAVPIDIALGALAICVAHAHYGLQKDPVKRNRNIQNFNAAVLKAVNMVITEEGLQAQQLEAAQKSDPIRKLN